ncbi:putative methyltransferase-domain-containing protein [Xylaria bambusicola]|uniref:putative methyltransferase-domain-containing protein n=1 Tax=Xylaria bambusicola TaxID=326684 RepID=UPI0020085380|nr:putative methyltransferase-domain-containing protein [Xylaria bambusicola]KAI0512886.1 putative methyltransferase-domain-containing protein [Xylaria bambusicola]
MADVDPQLRLLKRQYFQLFEPDFLAWPHPQLLRRSDAQAWLFKHLFDETRNAHLPPERYQLRVLRPLVARIEKSIQDPEEDEISDDLMGRIGALMTHGVPSEFETMKERAYVTFTCLPESQMHKYEGDDGITGEEPTITLLERRNLISGSRTTGHRTWEAALHLGSYLLTKPGHDIIAGKSILELGAGTGFLAILCAKHLGARHVTTTDGDESVVDYLKENLVLNDIEERKSVTARTLWWGEELKGTWVEEECSSDPYDVVIGADITYDKEAIKALIQTLQHLFQMRPGLLVIIAGVVRNADTFQTFQNECAHSNFAVEEITFPAKPMREQKALFYAAAVPIRILRITSGG